MKKYLAGLFLVLLSVSSLFAEEDERVIDKIVIDGTWMTRDFIILSKLGFDVGDKIGREELDMAEKNLYELKLFSKVEFSWVEEEDGTTTLHVLAKDQLHIMPLVAIDGSSNTIKLGAADGNFLGFNVDLSLGYEQEKEYAQYDFIKRRIKGSFSLPDTLLNGFTFKQTVDIGITGNAEHDIATEFSLPKRWFSDWGWSFNFAKKLDVNYEDLNGVKLSGFSNDVWEFGTTLRPSLDIPLFPMFSLGWKSETIGDNGVMDTVFTADAGTTSFIDMGAGLTFGEILTKNSYFQQNGWKAFAGYNLGIKTSGDPSVENIFHQFNIGAEGHLLVFKWLELAGYADYALTSSNRDTKQYNIRVHETRDRSVPGLSVSGTNYYAVSAQAHITYVNIDWFALEHVAWFDMAQAGSDIPDLFSEAPKMAVGTGLRFRIPNIPWLYFYIDIQWALPETGQDFWGIKI